MTTSPGTRTPCDLDGSRPLQERSALLEADDAFILFLCDEQEHELLALRDRTDALTLQMRDVEATQQIALHRTLLELSSAEERLRHLCLETERLREDLARVRAQRDESRGVAIQIASERDQALIALSRARSGDPKRGAVSSVPGDPPSRPVARLEFERWPEDSIPARPSPFDARGLTGQGPAWTRRSSSAPSLANSSAQGERAARKRSFGQRPDPSTRPLISYSLRGSEVAVEHLERATLPSRRPER